MFLIVFWVATMNAFAIDYPIRPITIIVPFPLGGSSDVQARILAKSLSEQLKQPVIVDNRPGAGGRIGLSVVARARPDGYTILFGSLSTLVVEPALRPDVAVDVQKDLAPVALISRMPFLLVVANSFPAKNLADLVVQATGHPGSLSFASGGPGSTAHLLGEMLRNAAHIELVHVPYKGEGSALIDVLGGQVSMLFTSPLGAMPHLQSSKLRALAVTSDKRVPAFPDVPSFSDAGIGGMELIFWSGLLVPAGTPPEIIDRLNRETAAVLNSAGFKRFAEEQGIVALPGSPADLAARIRSDSIFATKLIRTLNLKAGE